MKKSRRIGTIAATITAAAGIASVATAAPAAAAVGRGSPHPVSVWLRPVPANADSWVNIFWRSSRTVCNAKVRVNGGPQVDVAYPGHRRSTSFPSGHTLRAGRTDHTAIKVGPDFDHSGLAHLRATIEYDYCGWQSNTEAKTFVLLLPVIRDGDPLTGPVGPGMPGAPVILPGTPAEPGGPVILPGTPSQPGGPVVLPGTPAQPGGPVVLPGTPTQPGGPVVLPTPGTPVAVPGVPVPLPVGS